MSNHQKSNGTQELLQFLLSTPKTSISPDQETKHLLCFSHLRWDFVYQRPQHLLSRASAHYRVWFWEEPIYDDQSGLEIRRISTDLHVVIPHVPPGTDPETANELQRRWLNELLTQQRITDYISWYYTPMALAFTDQLRPRLTLYDCMDELSAFQGASPLLRERERQLMQQAELVFTGGYSLFEAKQKLHPAVHAFPSSIDYDHFATARKTQADPVDQQSLPYPRIGYSGVIDERFDLNLLEEIARRRPDWQFVLLGPVVKIDPATLPQGPNLHYLGMKSYADLPTYFSNWQVALLPFALNESTRFISPTKTPEYLAAGLPIVSTPIRDVVTTYGGCGPVWIAETVVAFEQAIDEALKSHCVSDWADTDALLQKQSWQQTWQTMRELIEKQLLPSGPPFARQKVTL
jgi:glycosyltransferase involved in cell wall biosynthesis